MSTEDENYYTECGDENCTKESKCFPCLIKEKRVEDENYYTECGDENCTKESKCFPCLIKEKRVEKEDGVKNIKPKRV